MWSWFSAVEGSGGNRRVDQGLWVQQKQCRSQVAMTMGSRREKWLDCSDMPTPVGEVELAELLYVSVTMVELTLEPTPGGLPDVVFWETTCVDKHIANTITPR